MPTPTAEQIERLIAADPALGRAMERVPAFPGFPDAETAGWSHFQALARSIVFQQLATAAARTIHGRVCALTDGDGFPGPSELLALSDTELRGAGLSRSKTKALRDLAGKVVSGEVDLEELDTRDDEEVVQELTAVWGIGPWTARMFLIFKLGRLDVIAPGDLGIQEGLRRLDGLEERPGPDRVLARADDWRPLRSVACWVLWRLTEVDEVEP